MKTKIFILLIVVIAAFFRLFQLDSIPPSPSLDEVSIGYNAFSILKTGADEFGERFPILLRAYDDWRPALYVYLVIPFVKLFGLSVLAVRLPSAILGIITIFITYLISKELFKKNGEKIGLIAALFLAISPWHIYITRLGHETNPGIAFLLIGIYFFLKFINNIKKNRFIILSFIFFSLSFDSYQSTKIVVPLIVISLLSIYLNEIKNSKKNLFIAGFFAFIIAFPILISFFSPNALIRFQSTSIFSNQEVRDSSAKQLLIDRKNGDKLGLIIHNRRVGYSMSFLSAYITHLDPSWLLLNKKIVGGEQFKIPLFGLLNIFEFPLIVLGLYYLLKREKKVFKLMALWILISILPGALTNGYPHAMRILNILPSLQIIGAVGAYGVYLYFKKNNKEKIYLVLSILILLFTSIMLYASYFVIFPRERANQFQYGVIQAFQEASKIENEYDSVIVSKKEQLAKSYMFYVFYKKMDPRSYLKNGGTVSGGYDENHKIGKYFFGDLDRKSNGKELLIINPKEIDKRDMRILKKIYFPNGEKALYIVERGELIPEL